MIDSLPFFAPSTPPDTGASRKSQPAFFINACACFAVSGATVEWSTTIVPGRACAAISRTTPSTSASALTHSAITSQSGASSAIVAGAATPCSAANACAFSALRLLTAASRPALRKCPAIGKPMAPKPTNPTLSSFTSCPPSQPRDVGWALAHRLALHQCKNGGPRPTLHLVAFRQIRVAGQPGLEYRRHARRAVVVDAGSE